MAESPVPVEQLVDGVVKGDHRAIAKALSRVEDTRASALPDKCALVRMLGERTPPERAVVGITGPPGAGKSTLAGALIERWVDAGEGVGMTAIDPSSRRSGGALLGDRARIRVEPGAPVFIRSMATGERLGGLAPATRAATVVLRAAFAWTIVETVGVGQSEIDIETLADTVLLVIQPGSGDTLQFMKAGIIEIPDVVVVHKWDLGELAERTLADLEAFVAMRRAPDGWTPRLIGASALTGHGLDEIRSALLDHRAWLESSGTREVRRARNRTHWALELFEERYGTLGMERLGGRASAEAIVAETPGTALDAFTALASRAGLEPTPHRDEA